MESNEALHTRANSSSRKMTVIAVVAVVVAVLAIVLAAVVIVHYNAKPKSATTAQQTQTGQLSNAEVERRVNAVFAAPNERPSVAQIADKSKLTAPFFQNAQNGDYVLIYPKAKMAVIYRPGTNHLVNAGPIATN